MVKVFEEEVQRMATATGRSAQVIKDAVFDIKSRAWRDHRVVIKDLDALKTLEEVIAVGDAALEMKKGL